MWNPPADPDPQEELPPGTRVSAVTGEPVGQVTHSALREGYFVLEKYWPFVHEVCLPARLIQVREPKGITLTLTKGELRESRWQVPPATWQRPAPTSPRWPPSSAESGGDAIDTGVIPLPLTQDDPPLTPC